MAECGSTTAPPRRRKSEATTCITSARSTRSGWPGGFRWSANRSDVKIVRDTEGIVRDASFTLPGLASRFVFRFDGYLYSLLKPFLLLVTVNEPSCCAETLIQKDAPLCAGGGGASGPGGGAARAAMGIADG